MVNHTTKAATCVCGQFQSTEDVGGQSSVSSSSSEADRRVIAGAVAPELASKAPGSHVFLASTAQVLGTSRSKTLAHHPEQQTQECCPNAVRSVDVVPSSGLNDDCDVFVLPCACLAGFQTLSVKHRTAFPEAKSSSSSILWLLINAVCGQLIGSCLSLLYTRKVSSPSISPQSRQHTASHVAAAAMNDQQSVTCRVTVVAMHRRQYKSQNKEEQEEWVKELWSRLYPGSEAT